MTEQKNCENCYFWDKVVESGTGAISNGGKFREPEQKDGYCKKHKKATSARYTCDDWEPKKIANK